MGKYMVRNGDLEGRKFRLEAGAKIALGRELSDLNFPDKRMSRRHCTLESRDDGDFIEDLGSTNGTWVNNQKVREALLRPGDLVRIGFTEFEFLGVPAAPHIEAPVLSANKTIAFRPAGMPKRPPTRDRRRFRGKSRIMAAKRAARGERAADTKRALISAKGKFCEACGEAIFVKEGAPDEGMVVEGLYLCRMCALISEKQKELGRDYLPSYAKIVGGRMAGGAGGVARAPPPAEGGAAAEGVEIIEEEEVDLDDLVPVDAAGAEPSATAPFDASALAEADEAEAARPDEALPDEADILRAVERAAASRNMPPARKRDAAGGEAEGTESEPGPPADVDTHSDAADDDDTAGDAAAGDGSGRDIG